MRHYMRGYAWVWVYACMWVLTQLKFSFSIFRNSAMVQSTQFQRSVADILAPSSDDEGSAYEDVDIIESDEDANSVDEKDENDGNKSNEASGDAETDAEDRTKAGQVISQFPALDSDDEAAETLLSAPVKRKGNTFAAMGLSKLMLTNIQRVGYNSPTPIQRKAMPPILDGRDVVAMARTGSGKTAAFVIPIIEKLMNSVQTKGVQLGIKALILSPNRELAMQTHKAVKELSRKTGLKSCFVVGGDSMEDQFGMILAQPDIVVATPGRFMHLRTEMAFSLSKCSLVVFDEADRLFEMGFQEQLTEIQGCLPDVRQSLLFSATLPPTLVQFAKAGLSNPLLIRLDAEQKISEQLEMAFFGVKDSERDAALLYILQTVIKLPLMTAEQNAYLCKRAQYETKGEKVKREPEVGPKDLPTAESTIVFVPTKHHVEYVATLLKQEGYAVSYIYGALDQAARREQLYLFRAGKTSVMVVTDVAARGVDIPLLANVVNYNIPTSARVFVHRVGRTARAGHAGWAYTLVRETDLPYLVDLQVFLGRRLVTDGNDYCGSLVLGMLPRNGLEPCSERVQSRLSRDADDLRLQHQVALRGEKMYLKSRESASRSSLTRAKRDLVDSGAWEHVHPLLARLNPALALEAAKDAMLARLNKNRIKETVFEFKKTLDGDAAQMMARRRAQIAPVQERLRKKQAAIKAEQELFAADDSGSLSVSTRRDPDYISHFEPVSAVQERGYDFRNEVDKSAFDISNEGTDFHSKQITRWDKKRGKYVRDENKAKFIKGEGGHLIPASLKSGRFEAWQKAHKVVDGEYAHVPQRRFKHNKVTAPKRADKYRDDYHAKKARPGSVQKPGSELRTAAEIRKNRQSKQKRWEKSNQPGRK